MSIVRTCIQFIDTAHPLQTAFWQVVECHQVVIAWKAVDGTDTQLMETAVQILDDLYWLLQALDPDISHIS
jgi:hypothetical protein